MCLGGGVTPNRYHPARRTCIGSPPSGRTWGDTRFEPACAPAHSRQSDRRGISASVRTTAACRLFPSGEALPSTTSAGSCLPLFDRFLGTTTSSDFSSAYMLGVRLLPSRAGPAQVRARVRPPRFRTKNFSTCTRSSTARGSSIQANTLWGMLPSRQRTRSAPRNSTRCAAQYSARGLPCERFTAALASRTSCITRGRGGWLDLPRGGLAPPILCQLSITRPDLGDTIGLPWLAEEAKVPQKALRDDVLTSLSRIVMLARRQPPAGRAPGAGARASVSG